MTLVMMIPPWNGPDGARRMDTLQASPTQVRKAVRLWINFLFRPKRMSVGVYPQ